MKYFIQCSKAEALQIEKRLIDMGYQHQHDVVNNYSPIDKGIRIDTEAGVYVFQSNGGVDYERTGTATVDKLPDHNAYPLKRENRVMVEVMKNLKAAGAQINRCHLQTTTVYLEISEGENANKVMKVCENLTSCDEPYHHPFNYMEYCGLIEGIEVTISFR
jgi:hypothetical protein